MGASAKTQHAIRRSTRLPIEVPVIVASLDGAGSFSEQCNTTLVNAHGCGLIVSRALERDARVRLEIVSAKRHTTARVAEVVPLGGDPETWLAGLELDVPGNFWGIEYAPSDWKVEGPPPVSELPKDLEPIAAAKPAHSRRWRLSDISAGGCYLETAEPFPAQTRVLLSIRASDAECLLDGIVRVSHEHVGMGVEFMQARDQQMRVEELIQRLAGEGEVPRIFVGRKEGLKEGPKEGHNGTPTDSPDAIRDSGMPDPLLDLIRAGASLSVEQFMHDLRAQRLSKSQ
jgi:hypothetical protein